MPFLSNLAFEARASAMEREWTDEVVDHEFRQCLLGLRIQSVDRELNRLRKLPNLTRELIMELDRLTREQAQLRGQRA